MSTLEITKDTTLLELRAANIINEKTFNAFRKAGMYHLIDFTSKTEEDLLEMRMIGSIAVTNIKDALSQAGLELKAPQERKEEQPSSTERENHVITHLVDHEESPYSKALKGAQETRDILKNRVNSKKIELENLKIVLASIVQLKQEEEELDQKLADLALEFTAINKKKGTRGRAKTKE